MKTINRSGWLLLLVLKMAGQEATTLSLEQCYTLSKQNYPLVKQAALVEKTREYTVDNASKAYLPQINFAGQATYQSEVTKIPIALPNVNIQQLSKDQYRIYGEISQSLTDPLVIKRQKEYINTNAAAESEKLEVELYKLRERINQVYFGILLIDAQIQQTELFEKEILAGIKKTEAAIANGISFKSSSDLLNAELLKLQQRSTELKANKKAYIEILSVFIKQKLDDTTKFVTPALMVLSATINRPELKWFEAQKKNFEIQEDLLKVKNLPKLSLFFQGGYGRPTLNALSNDFGSYYIGGARFSWNMSGFYTYQKEKKIQKVNSDLIDVQKDLFLFNTELTLKQQNHEITKMNELIESDRKIILLREKIKTAATSQLENGTITPIDYLNHLNAEDQARQVHMVHKIQLLMAQYNYQTISGI